MKRTRMPFGKWRDSYLDEIDQDYLEWLVSGEIELKPWLHMAVTLELESRGYFGYSEGKDKGKHSEGSIPHTRVPATVSYEVAEQVISAGRRALARKHHPDIGGDHESMLVVNSTADWLADMSRRILEAAR